MKFFCTVILFSIGFHNLVHAKYRSYLGLQSGSVKSHYQSKSTTYEPIHRGVLGLSASAETESGHGVFVELWFMQKAYYSDNADSYLVETRPRVHITLAYQKSFWQRLLVGVGVGSAYPVGAKKVISMGGPSYTSLATSSEDITEYSIDAYLRVRFIRFQSFYGFVGYENSYSLTPRDQESANHGIYFIGIEKELP